ncbi:MAG: hypothetical protein AABW59_02045 [archaeon]
MAAKEKTKEVKETKVEDNVEVITDVKVAHKSHEKKSKQKDYTHLLIAGVAIVVLIAAIIFVISIYGSCRFSFEVEGVKYCSDLYTPTEFFEMFRQEKAIFISPRMTENAADPFLVNAMNLWLVVLNANGINTTQLIRVDNPAGTMAYCYTNLGDFNVSQQMPLEECNKILGDKNNVFVFIDKSSSNEAFLSNKRIEIRYASSAEAGKVNFSVIKQAFPNAQRVIDIINEKIYGVNAGS